MSLKLKHLFPIFALTLGIGTALLISRVKAFAADASNSETTTSVSNNNWVVNAYSYNGFANIDYVDQFQNNGVFYSTIGSTSDILLNLSITPQTTLRGNYINGSIYFNYKPTVTLTNPAGFTLSNCKYSAALVYSSNDSVNCAITNVSSSGNYTIKISFNDYYDFSSNQIIGLTIGFRVTALAQWSGSSLNRPNSIPLSIAIGLSSLTEQVSASTISFNELAIRSAIDSSVDTQGILDQLITVNAHMVWSDGAVVYDIADLLWMLNGNQMTGNSTAQSILNSITTDSSGLSTQANNEINQAHNGELNAQNDMQNLLLNISDGSYVTGPNTQVQIPDFQEGLAQIASGVSNGRDFLNNNAKAIQFWTYVGDTLLDRNHFGYIASFLCIVLVLGFTVWVLKL